jgi:hypothetical protein
MSSRFRANKIECEPFVNGGVPSLIVEELPFNKFHPLRANKIGWEHMINGQVPSVIVRDTPQ